MAIVLVNFNLGIPITTSRGLSDTINIDGSAAGTPNAKSCDALFVGGAGIVQGVFQNGVVCAFTVVAGEMLPCKFIRINATSTTATLMVAMYLGPA